MPERSASGPLTTLKWMSPGAPLPSPSSRDRERRRCHDYHDIDGGERWRYRGPPQFRDDAARALRAVFSSRDNWPNLSEAERDEWRCYFDRMLQSLHDLGYATDCELWSLRPDGIAKSPPDDGAS
jgi:hypothetical protein